MPEQVSLMVLVSLHWTSKQQPGLLPVLLSLRQLLRLRMQDAQLDHGPRPILFEQSALSRSFHRRRL